MQLPQDSSVRFDATSEWPRRRFIGNGLAFGILSLASPFFVQRMFGAPVSSATPAAGGAVAESIDFRLTGWIRGYLDALTKQWLEVAPSSNPVMLGMFRDQDRQPLRDMVPWAGEFAGKYLTSAVQVYRVTRDETLRGVIAGFVERLVALQAGDGYLGPWPAGCHLTGVAPNCSKGRGTWDAWGHYHIMVGLIKWHETTGDQAALTAARKIADLICDTFADKRIVDTGNTEMNLAPIHSLCLLYRCTGEKRYLRMAEKIRDEFSATDAQGARLAGDYVNGPLSGKDYFELPLPRWEGLHPVMGLAELALLTGDAASRQAFEAMWWSIVRWDRHNNGGFSSAEKAVGNPYHRGAIETCSTVAWAAMSALMLKLREDAIIADELEFSTVNSIVGFHSPSGRWVVYNCPMDGIRRSSTQELVSQARPGGSELSCCSVNGARGLGMIEDWAVMRSADGLILNWYGSGSIGVPLERGRRFTFEQETTYPRDPQVRINLQTTIPEKLVLKLRIPHWSHSTKVSVNGQPVGAVEPGRYLVLDRTWKTGDAIDIEFDFTLQYWVGEREYAGKVSVYRGPVLLAYDRQYNAMDPNQVPALEARELRGTMVNYKGDLPPLLLLEFKAVDGSALRLCDFASAGFGGDPYRTWLEVSGCRPTEFSRANPRRSAPAG